MPDLICIRQPGGSLAPATDEDAEALRKIKTGSAVRVEIRQIRNYKFHRKWFALAKLAFDIWSETVPQMEYRGVEVKPDFDRFRRDLVILTGRFKAVYSARGDVRVEAESISFANMAEDKFEKLYSDTIDVVLRKILNDGRMTEDQLRSRVEAILSYA